MFDATRSLRRGFAAVAWWLTSSSGLAAQTVALGAGALITNDFTDPVLELYVAGPRVRVVQPYAIGSWQLSDRQDDARPTVIAALESPWVVGPRVVVSPAIGVIGFPSEDYDPHGMINTTTIVALPIPRAALTTILATQPFDDWEWSIVVKVAVLVYQRR